MKTLFVGKTRSVHIQFLRYLFVGGSSAVLDLVIYKLLLDFTAIHYLLAAFIAYMFGLVWNYVTSVVWIFQSRHGRKKEFLMVFFIACGGLFWTELLLYLFVDFARIDAFYSKVIALWIVLLWNFGMRKFYVFH